MNKPVLVTGLGRSGTTWVGSTLCLSGELHYVHEAAGAHTAPRKWPMKLPLGRSPYFCHDNEDQVLDKFADVVQLKYPLASRLREVRSLTDAMLAVQQFRAAKRARQRGIPPLLKDPGLFFSAPWIEERFGAQVIMMVRHPASVISSIKRLGWKPDFHNWLDQPLVLRDHLGVYEHRLRERVQSERDPIDDGILLWNMYNDTLRKFRAKYPWWILIRQEDIAADPVTQFQELYKKIGLEWNEKVKNRVEEMTGSGNPSEDPLKKVWTTIRDSKATTTTWRSRLTVSEVKRIKAGTAEVSGAFYKEDEW